ncbi:MAG: DUF2341 domain-containing protein, partial [Methanomicrobiales archaeon]|nr:DUF2341 domain-containing protein [Methanomicrobiales archaeon]
MSGTLWITADDGYNLSLNGVAVGKKGLNSGWRTSNLKYAYVPGHGLWKSVEQYDLMNVFKTLKEGTNTFTLSIQTANRYMGCDNYLPSGVTATDSDNPTDSGTVSLVASTGSDLVACGSSCAEPKGTTSTNIGGLIYEAKICTDATSTKDAWVLSDNFKNPVTLVAPVNYFDYQLKRIAISVDPFQTSLALPEQTSQTITYTVKDRETALPDEPLVFTASFGSFTAGKQVQDAAAQTNNNGVATVTISSPAPEDPIPPAEPTPVLAWYDSPWQYRKAITIDKARVAGSLSDFPVLISLVSDPDLSAKARSDGFDILFTSSDGTAKLSHEIESYDGNTGALVAWVKIPSVSPSDDTVLYLYYGNPTASDQQDPAGVWDANYLGVWHLKEAGTGAPDEYKDSTTNAQNGQGGEGDPLYVPTLVAGKIGNGQDFNNLDGKFDLIDLGDDPVLDVPGNQITLEAWVREEVNGERPYGILNHKGWYDGYSIWVQGDHWQCPTSLSNCVQFNLPGQDYSLRTDTILSANTWHHVVGTYNGNSMAVFIDGLADSEALAKSDAIKPASYQRDVWIGHGDQPTDVAWSAEWEGQIDEVRISRVGRSDAWIKTEYNNMNSPSTFHYLWDEEVRPRTVTTLTLSPESATLQLHSPASQLVTATVLDQNGVPMSALPVTFTTVFGSGGTQAMTVNTDENGQASVTITSSMPDTATVTATAGGLSTTSVLTWLAAPEASGITLTASPTTIQVPEATPASLTATVQDQYGQPMPNTLVTFTTEFNDGTSTVTTVTTVPADPSGVASTGIIETTAGTAIFTATSGNAASTPVTVTWLPPPQPTLEPTPDPTPEQTPQPVLEPTPDPTPEPTLALTPDPTPEPTLALTPDPTP